MKKAYQILYFSATGNTYFLATKLSKILECEIINFNDEINCNHLIIMSSIHAFRVPSFLKKKIKDIKYLSIIAVGCNTSKINSAAGNTLIKYAKKKDIEICNYKVLAMPLTIVKKFDLEYGKKIIQESLNSISDIGNNILNQKKDIIKIPFSSKVISNVHYIESLFVKLFGLELYANKKCIKCSLCIKNCPKKNIKMKKKPKFGLNCMLCMKCIYNCPVKAIHPRISKFIEFKDGYNLKEYIEKDV